VLEAAGAMMQDAMEPARPPRSSASTGDAVTDETRALVRGLLRDIAPDVDVDTVDSYRTLHDVAGLDSLDFLRLMDLVTDLTGVVVPPHDYPELITVDGFARYLEAHRARRSSDD
jgi:acyl carrier protein